jgi:outer membrane protein OmpA-like peptidoglycan-associated protein
MSEQKKSVFSSVGVLAAGIAVAAVAYFWAKPAHKGVQGEQAAATVAATPATASTTSTAAPVAAPTADATAASAAPVVLGKADAQIFFAVGKSSLPDGAGKLLEPVIAKMKLNTTAKAYISGFNDATGDKEKNALLSKERAKSVREALRAAGVAGDADARIEMRKPEETMGGVDAEAARRVEVTVQ